MNVSGTPSFPGATALPDSLLVSLNIGVLRWLLVTSLVSHDSVVEEVASVHRVLSNEFFKTQFSAVSLLPQFSLINDDVSSELSPKSLL